MRRAAKIDNNQREIVKALRMGGISVEVGHDDILVGHKGKTYWYEIKTPETVSKKTGKVRASEITDSELKRSILFRGHYKIVWTLDQILKDIGIT